jgi:hypothetical protein
LWHSGPGVALWYADFLKSGAAVAIGALLVVLDGRVALHRMFGGPRRSHPMVKPPPVFGKPGYRWRAMVAAAPAFPAGRLN